MEIFVYQQLVLYQWNGLECRQMPIDSLLQVTTKSTILLYHRKSHIVALSYIKDLGVVKTSTLHLGAHVQRDLS